MSLSERISLGSNYSQRREGERQELQGVIYLAYFSVPPQEERSCTLEMTVSFSTLESSSWAIT